MRVRTILLTLVLLAALAGGGMWGWRTYGPGPDDGSLTLYGNVDIRQVDLAFNAEGKIAEIPVEEGDRVENGDVLARLERETPENIVAAAEARLAESRARLTELENGTRPQEIERARAAVDQAQARVELTRVTRERRERLRGPSYVSESAYDEAVRAHEEAKAELRQREAELQLALDGPREEKIAAARAQVDFNEATLGVARERLDNTTLTAPEAGTVLTRVREPGATVGPTATVLTLALRKPMRVRTYVSETNLGRVEPGMPVAVTTDSFPDKTYAGQVGFISPTAEFTPKTVQTPELRTDLVYRVRIIVDAPDEGLRQGMPVTIELRPKGETGS